MGSSLLLSAQPQPQIRLLKTMKVLLCLHLSEGFSYRGNVMRNRNRGSGSRSYLRNLGSGGEKRSLSSLRGFTGRRSSYKRAGEAPEQEPEEKRGISSLKGKRAFGMALSSLRSRGRGKRGALSSLRNQGFVKYNI